MRILVMGGCGFIGFEIVWCGFDVGYDVVNIDVLIYLVNLFNLECVEYFEYYCFFYINICDV